MRWLNMKNDGAFAMRQNQDGSFDSICLRCFQTVKADSTRGGLKRFEKNHECSAHHAAPVTAFPEKKSAHQRDDSSPFPDAPRLEERISS